MAVPGAGAGPGGGGVLGRCGWLAAGCGMSGFPGGRSGLMPQYGAVLGLPFGVEGIFFVLKAIFAGIDL